MHTFAEHELDTRQMLISATDALHLPHQNFTNEGLKKNTIPFQIVIYD